MRHPSVPVAALGVLTALAALTAVTAAGCSEPSAVEASTPSVGCTERTCPPPSQCPEGFQPDSTTGACLDLSPAEDCPAGTGAFLGSATCQPVGWTSCAPPFENDPSGWGCQAIVPESCPAGSLGTLGSRACRPVGDCAQPFPPPEATIFVDASFATTDGTHFTSLFEAVQSAGTGAVVAVAAGTYREDVDVTRSKVSIVGKCAAEVIVQNPGDRRAGILVAGGVRGVKVRGLTLTGHYSGMLVKGGSEATLEDSVVVHNRWQGVYSAEPGSVLRVARTLIDDVVVDDQGKFGWGATAQLGGALELEDVVVLGATASGIVVGGPASRGKLTRVVVQRTRNSAAGFGTALSVIDGGSAELEGALFDRPSALGVTVSGGRLTARHMIVSGTELGAPAAVGRGVQVSKGAKVELTESVVADSHGENIVIVDQGSAATVAATVVRGALGGDGRRGDHGIGVAGGGSLTLSGSAIVASIETGLAVQDAESHVDADGVLVTDTRPRLDAEAGELLGIGAGVVRGGTLAMKHSSLARNRAAGLLVSNMDASGRAPHADLVSTWIGRTRPNASVPVGRGLQVSSGGTVSLDRCAVVENMEVAALIGGTGSRLDVKESVVRDTRLIEGGFGHGLLADSRGTLTVEGSWLLGHAGVAVVVFDAQATLSRSVVGRSTVGIHVQGETQLATADDVPAEPEALTCVVSNDTRFVDNQTRLGAGALPLPSPLVDAPHAAATAP